jgi:hypothetical protein
MTMAVAGEDEALRTLALGCRELRAQGLRHRPVERDEPDVAMGLGRPVQRQRHGERHRHRRRALL